MSKENQVHEVEVELSENFLEKNPTIKSLYKEGKLQLPFLDAMSNEFGEAVRSLVPELRGTDIVAINPLFEAIDQLLKYDNVIGTAKPEREAEMDDKTYSKVVNQWIKEQDEVRIAMEKDVSSFNGVLRDSKKIVKAPIIEMGKKVDNLYNLLKDFSDKRKEKIDTNFKESLDEKERIKQEKERIKNEKAEAQLKALQEQNEENTKKIIEAQKKSSYADKMVEITNFFTASEKEIQILNEAGLMELVGKVKEHEFGSFEDYSESQQETLNALITQLKDGILVKIKKAIEEKEEAVAPVAEETIEEEANLSPEFVEISNENNQDKAMFRMQILRLKNALNEVESIKPINGDIYKSYNEKMNVQYQALSSNLKKLISHIEKKIDKLN